MKHKFLSLLSLLLLATLGIAQNPITAPSGTFGAVTFPVYTLNAVPVPGATLQVVGQPGTATWCYWAVANFQIGSVLSPLGCVQNAANTLSVSNYVAITPWSYPLSSTSVDILATTGFSAPTGACACAVATSLTSGGTNQQSNTTSAYTVSIVNPSSFALTVRNEVTGTGAVSLLLRDAAGNLICNLSVGCGTGTVSGTGTANTLAMWTGSAVLGNSPITYNGTNRLTSTAALSINPGPNSTPGVNLFTTYATGQCAGVGSVYVPVTNCPTQLVTAIFPTDSAGDNSALKITGNVAGNLSGTPALSGGHADMSWSVTGTPTWLSGLVGITSFDGASGTAANAGGVYGQAALGSNATTTQTATVAFGVGGQITNLASTNTQPLAGALVAFSPSLTAPVTSIAGLYIQDQTPGGASNPHPHGVYEVGNAPNQFQGHMGQVAAGNWANSCAMAAGTSCTFTLTAAYTGTPLCVVSPVTTTPASVQAGACSVSGTTVTITAATSNSLTWDAVLIGNPN